MARRSRYSQEVRERAVRMVLEQLPEHESEWAAICSIARKLGCAPETLRKWVRQVERDAGKRPGPATAERERIKELERENRELKRANEILRKATLGSTGQGGARPPTEVMAEFIDEQRDVYGVEPICAMPPIAPSTYYERKAQQKDPSLRSKRAKRDDELETHIQRVWDENHGVYGAQKVWRQLRREKVQVARCTVERLMRKKGLRGVVRGRAFKVTTVADDAAERPRDLVNREFSASAPNQPT